MAVMEAQHIPKTMTVSSRARLSPTAPIRMWAAGILLRASKLITAPEEALSKEQVALVNDLVTKACDVRHERFLERSA